MTSSDTSRAERTGAPLSLETKLLLLIWIPSGILVAVTCLAFLWIDKSSTREILARRVEVLADVMARNSTAALSFDDARTATDILASLEAQPRVVRACLHDGEGSIFATYARRGADVSGFPASRSGRHVVFTPVTLQVFHPVVLGERRLGGVFLESDLVEIDERFRSYAGIALAMLAGLMIVGLFLSLRLRRVISSPILDLAATIREVGQRGDYHMRATRQTRDEVGFLTESFNEMLSRVAHRDDSLRRSEERARDLVETLSRRTEELERSNRDLEQFAYVASHDLKAPLRAIAHLVDWLEEDVGEGLPETGRDYLGKIRSRVGRLQTMVEDLLVYSRAGRERVVDQEVRLDDLVREIWEMLDPGTTARLEASAPQEPVVTCVAALRQVLTNLVGNALKHHDRPDPKIGIRIDTEGPVLRIVVKDDGPGIPAEYHERIFEMFTTLRRRDEVEGSGMGLAIVRKLVRYQGGQVRLVSEPGAGAEFRIEWPLSCRRQPEGVEGHGGGDDGEPAGRG